MKLKICSIILLINIINCSREINKILVNDLNIIATKLDEIPETNLNLKLILISQECNNARLKWNIQNSIKSSEKFKQETNTKIFGYQVVVREYLEKKERLAQDNLSSEEQMMKKKDKTLKVYSSKFIDSRQNKFKLVNLMRKDKASYLICLIIYMDVTETVAFEKQCVSFSLPSISDDLKCKSDLDLKNSSKKSFGKKLVTPMTKSMSDSSTIQNIDSYNISQSSNFLNQSVLKSMEKLRKNFITLSQHNCEHTSACSHYSNLVVAFVICGVLLGTNIFMFTIIIIQNTIKLSFLKRKLNLIRQNPKLFYVSNYDANDRTFTSVYDNKNKLSHLKSALCLSWSDFIRIICCGVFENGFNLNKSKVDGLKNIENFGIHNEPIYDSDFNQSCTTITRPGYILQVPNSSSSESSSDISTPFNKEKNAHHKYIKSENANNKKFNSNIEDKKMKRNSLVQNKYVYEEKDDGLFNQVYAVSELRQTEDLKNQLAYHQNNIYGHQISSAF